MAGAQHAPRGLVHKPDFPARAGKDIALVLAGNKVDMERSRQVSQEESEAYAASIGAALFGTSAKLNRGVEQAFLAIARSACAWLRLCTWVCFAFCTNSMARRACRAAERPATAAWGAAWGCFLSPTDWHGRSARERRSEAETSRLKRMLLTQFIRAQRGNLSCCPRLCTNEVQGKPRSTRGQRSASEHIVHYYVVLRLASSFRRLRSASRLLEVPESRRARTRLPSLPLPLARLRLINSRAWAIAASSELRRTKCARPRCKRAAHLLICFDNVANELIRVDHDCATSKAHVARDAVRGGDINKRRVFQQHQGPDLGLDELVRCSSSCGVANDVRCMCHAGRCR